MLTSTLLSAREEDSEFQHDKKKKKIRLRKLPFLQSYNMVEKECLHKFMIETCIGFRVSRLSDLTYPHRTILIPVSPPLSKFIDIMVSVVWKTIQICWVQIWGLTRNQSPFIISNSKNPFVLPLVFFLNDPVVSISFFPLSMDSFLCIFFRQLWVE